MSAQAARRRRRQASNNYMHLSPMKRPKYTKRSKDVAQRRLQERIEREKLRAMRKGQKS